MKANVVKTIRLMTEVKHKLQNIVERKIKIISMGRAFHAKKERVNNVRLQIRSNSCSKSGY